MATKIKEVVSARMLYPWADWMNGDAWRCKKGKDFQCEPAEFRSRVIVQARRANLVVTTSVKGNAVEFKFSKEA